MEEGTLVAIAVLKAFNCERGEIQIWPQILCFVQKFLRPHAASEEERDNKTFLGLKISTLLSTEDWAVCVTGQEKKKKQS